MDKLKNININKDMMYTLIAYAFKPKNEYLRDSILIVLYDKDESEDKRMFLNCFKKTEKGVKALVLKDFQSLSMKRGSNRPYAK